MTENAKLISAEEAVKALEELGCGRCATGQFDKSICVCGGGPVVYTDRAIEIIRSLPAVPQTHVHEFGEWNRYVWIANDGKWRERRFCKCGEYQFRDVSAPAVPQEEGGWQTNHEAADWLRRICAELRLHGDVQLTIHELGNPDDMPNDSRDAGLSLADELWLIANGLDGQVDASRQGIRARFTDEIESLRAEIETLRAAVPQLEPRRVEESGNHAPPTLRNAEPKVISLSAQLEPRLTANDEMVRWLLDTDYVFNRSHSDPPIPELFREPLVRATFERDETPRRDGVTLDDYRRMFAEEGGWDYKEPFAPAAPLPQPETRET